MNTVEDLNDLSEEITCQTLVESVRTFADEVIQVTTVFRSFENENPTILMKKVIQQMNDVLHFSHATKENHFQGKFPIRLNERERKNVTIDAFILHSLSGFLSFVSSARLSKPRACRLSS
jgi:hypothetical protein